MKYAKPYDREVALNAALSLFWQKGFHATSLKDLEDALNMKPGSIYAAFKSKDNLYALALRQYFESSQDIFVEHVLEGPSPLAGLVGMIRRMGQAKEGDPVRRPCMLIKAVINATDDTAEAAELARGYRARIDQNMREAFSRAQKLGELPTDVDPEALAQQYQTDVTGLQIEATMKIDQTDFQRSVEAKAKHYEDMRLNA